MQSVWNLERPASQDAGRTWNPGEWMGVGQAEDHLPSPQLS